MNETVTSASSYASRRFPRFSSQTASSLLAYEGPVQPKLVIFGD